MLGYVVKPRSLLWNEGNGPSGDDSRIVVKSATFPRLWTPPRPCNVSSTQGLSLRVSVKSSGQDEPR
ncbi:hypothetical protein E2C01_052251 [Portunus trituberculatus]|uniref:Uncharacterized protein n=1 Tax=Portunus trituberculatus TaxID=210409 RepID=A0A5B7GLF6_PORTR|nr:hypothetical protein [Portunus trituberculatus]